MDNQAGVGVSISRGSRHSLDRIPSQREASRGSTYFHASLPQESFVSLGHRLDLPLSASLTPSKCLTKTQ